MIEYAQFYMRLGKISKLACILIGLSVAITSVRVLAEPLSELNLKEFEHQEYKTSIRGQSPFTPRHPSAEEMLAEDLTLNGIVYNQLHAYALISGFVLQVGDRIAGYKVAAIDPGRVVLKYLDDVFVLKLPGVR